MPDKPKQQSSFSRASRWGISFDMALRTVLVVAVVVMVNFLGATFYHLFYLSSQTRVKLSSRTLEVLHSLTNHVDITLYYDRKDNFYPDIVGLLNQYCAASRNISVRTVDYLRDAGEAEKVKEKYHLSAESDKNLIIFDCDGRWKVFPGKALTQYKYEMVPSKNPKETKLNFNRKPVYFNGELAFTSMLLALENPEPLKAYYLQGSGEPSLTDDGNLGYQKFASVIRENYVTVTNLYLQGNEPVPKDCNLLIIAAPTKPLFKPELKQIAQYLQEGGRLLVMFNLFSIDQPTGLEPILRKWGVNVVPDFVQDLNHTVSTHDVIVYQFGKSPVVASLLQQELQLYSPRPVLPMNLQNANAPQVEPLFWTSSDATLANHPSEPPRSYPLACSIEQKPVAGESHPRGNTRIIVIGDSICFGNYYIQGGTGGANRDFLNAAVNWLLARPQLVTGIGPRPVTEFRLLLTQKQQQQLRWLLLGALPGSVLALGWFVWLVRRK